MSQSYRNDDSDLNVYVFEENGSAVFDIYEGLTGLRYEFNEGDCSNIPAIYWAWKGLGI